MSVDFSDSTMEEIVTLFTNHFASIPHREWRSRMGVPQLVFENASKETLIYHPRAEKLLIQGILHDVADLSNGLHTHLSISTTYLSLFTYLFLLEPL